MKDLDLMRAVDRADATPAADAIASRWHALVDSGLGDLDVSAARHGLGHDLPADPASAPIHRLACRETAQVVPRRGQGRTA